MSRGGKLPISRTAIAGLAATAMAAGAATTYAVQKRMIDRALGRRRIAEAEEVQPRILGTLSGTPHTVEADDGVHLYVDVDELDGDETDRVTVVFCHGYALQSAAWHFQREHFRTVPGIRRLVFFDQRGHGRSARGPAQHATIDQLGRDLGRVLDRITPDGSVVLVGHSMGGMTVMALADARPELFGSRIVGVALLSTSPGRLAEVTLGAPAAVGRVFHRLAPPVFAALGRAPTLVQQGRRFSRDLELLVTRYYGFASRIPLDLLEWHSSILMSTPVEVIAEFFPAFDAHDKLGALGVLGDVEVLLLCGVADLMTPPAHTARMAEVLPDARLVLVPDAGHMVVAERPDVVNSALDALVDRVRTAHP